MTRPSRSSRSKYLDLAKTAINLDKSQICRFISDRTKVPFKDVESIINILLEEIVRELKSDRKVKIQNFGAFELFQTKQHRIFNIHTNEHDVVESKKRLRFSLDRKLASFLSNFVKLES